MVRIQSSKDEPRKRHVRKSDDDTIEEQVDGGRFKFALFPNGIFTTFRPERHKRKRGH